jgi:glycosyltransferase involved in cell wall biosynthesis
MDQEKRVLHVTKAYWPHLGGVETVVRQLAEGAVKSGWDAKVLCLGEEHQETQLNGVDVLRVKTRMKLGSAPLSPEFVSEFKRLANWAHVIHFQVPNPMGELAFLLAGKGKAKLALCTYQSDPVRPKWAVPFYRPILRAFLENCDEIVATSPAYARTSSILSSFSTRVKVVPLAVEQGFFEEIEDSPRERVKRRIVGLPSPVGLFVGRLVYYKGVETLIRALGSVPELSLIIVGDGALKQGLFDLCAELRLQDRVFFLPSLPAEEYPAIFGCADFFVLPSVERAEAFGLVALEAMAAGLPVVTTELGTGTSFYNEEGKTGFVVMPKSVKKLAEALKILTMDKELRKEMGLKAKEQAKLFTVEKMVRSYMEIYEIGESGK